MEFATGAMSSLLPKLEKLLVEEYNLKESVKKGIGDLKAELESMQGALKKLSSVPLDQLDEQVKIWANEVRELSYFIEDSLDSFVTRVQGVEPAKRKIKHLFKMVRNELTKFNARHEIAGDIKDIESQVMKIKERYERYKINDIVPNPTSTAVDPRLSALYKKVSDLVGTDEPIDELMKILSEGVATSQKNLKIVSIVGFGGLGKTTLAKVLYDKLSQAYQCRGFVPVGQKQEVKKVLRDIIFELDKKLYNDAATMDERQMIDVLQNFLSGKRYFMVIDDLWDVATWETIKCAFLDSHLESRIIITTRIVDVAPKDGRVYCIKPLSDDNSRMLFHTRTCGGEGVSRDDQPGEVTNKILKKCGGVPLAIITIASLLVSKPSAHWSKVYDGIGFGHEDNSDVHNTRNILSFSYYDLPPYLKTCLLYLGMYPEDRFIEKKTLIWRWISEGFVLDNQGARGFMLGESYYNQLVNKSLIHETHHDGNVGCLVHDLVLDMIHTKSMEVNFVTIQDSRKKEVTSSPNGRSNKVHRLALHGAKVEHNTDIQMEHVRSFNAITCSNSGVPSLLIFKVLRVLVIEDCDFLEGHSLEHLRKLVQLRYLGLVKTAVKLPEGIGQDLKFLEILDVSGGLICELPPSVGELENLRCLLADEGTRMKGCIGKLICLEELQLHSVEECPNFSTDLGKLTNLRLLDIKFEESEKIAGKDLAESVCNLHKIESLMISNETFVPTNGEPKINFPFGSLEDWAPSSRLNTVHLNNMILPRMPPCIDPLCVPLLSGILVCVEVVEARDIETLGRFPALLELILMSKDKRISYAFCSTEFQKLKYLVTNIEITLGEGALPSLESLTYFASAERKDALVPWNNRCPLLRKVTCVLDMFDCGHTDRRAAQDILGNAREYRSVEVDVQKMNYDPKEAGIIDNLRSILHGTGSDGKDIITRHLLMRYLIKPLEALLRDAAQPRVGRYGEQELRGFVTQFKSLFNDDAGTDQEEEQDNSETGSENSEINEESQLINAIAWILLDPDSDGEGITTHQRFIIHHHHRFIRDVVGHLEALLRDAAEPRLGSYDERELRVFVTELKSLLHQEEEPHSDATDSDDGDDDTKQTEVDNDVTTSSGVQEEGAVSLP